jgi:hypothetical protein
MLRNKSIFQISTLICLSSISICNLLIDLPTYYDFVDGSGFLTYSYISHLIVFNLFVIAKENVSALAFNFFPQEIDVSLNKYLF